MSPGQMLTGECQGDSSNMLKMDPGTYLKSLVKIGSATTDVGVLDGYAKLFSTAILTDWKGTSN